MKPFFRRGEERRRERAALLDEGVAHLPLDINPERAIVHGLLDRAGANRNALAVADLDDGHASNLPRGVPQPRHYLPAVPCATCGAPALQARLATVNNARKKKTGFMAFPWRLFGCDSDFIELDACIVRTRNASMLFAALVGYKLEFHVCITDETD